MTIDWALQDCGSAAGSRISIISRNFPHHVVSSLVTALLFVQRFEVAFMSSSELEYVLSLRDLNIGASQKRLRAEIIEFIQDRKSVV